MTELFSLFKVFALAAAISFGLTPAVIFVYRRLGWLESTARRRPMDTHEKPVPRGGGIPIFLSIAASLLVFVRLDQHLLGIILGAALIMAVGVIDDRLNLDPYLRLVLMFLSAGMVVMAGIGIPYINLPFLGIMNLDQPRWAFQLFGEQKSIWILADIFSLFWIVGIMNFVNWSKGVDGQLPGTVAAAALTIGWLSMRFTADITQWPVVILAMATAGSYAGFLPWNFYPQKIMPGYGGGALGGYLLAVAAILSKTKVGTLLVVLGVPITDAVYILIRRIYRGQSPVWGDRGHLHHYLLDKLGWSKRKVAMFYWLTAVVLGWVALRLNSQQKFYTIAAVALVLGGGLFWLKSFGQSSRRPGRSGG